MNSTDRPRWVAVKERPEDATPGAEWCPGLEDGGMTPTLPVWFATEARCRRYIRDVIGVAVLEPLDHDEP